MTDLEAMELELNKYKGEIELADTLIMLEKNKHFKKLFTEIYLKTYALSMLTFKGSMAAQEEKVQKHADIQLAGISGLQQFLANVRTTGILAKEKIKQAEAEREILLGEEI